jgi:hypothetical protein
LAWSSFYNTDIAVQIVVAAMRVVEVVVITVVVIVVVVFGVVVVVIGQIVVVVVVVVVVAVRNFEAFVERPVEVCTSGPEGIQELGAIQYNSLCQNLRTQLKLTRILICKFDFLWLIRSFKSKIVIIGRIKKCPKTFLLEE